MPDLLYAHPAMRRSLIVRLALPVALVLAAAAARAQVSVNLHALEGLTPVPPPNHVLPARPAMPAAPLPLPPFPPTAPALPAAPAAPAASITAGAAGASLGALPRPPPSKPPAAPVIAPVVLVGPPHPEPIPPPPAVAGNAPGAASSIPGGLRVTFGPHDAELNPVTLAALKRLAAAAAKADARSVSVDAYAAGDPSDPSTPRRLSLSRALAARAVLREAGVPSERIYVRALLADPAGTAPANRVDVTIAPARSAAKGSP
ncbi:MAG: hypothetical protein M0002_06285 [Rhodospirillales bacterium]|nr:hypothetical protein [Rhodospirillales bacterium]